MKRCRFDGRCGFSDAFEWPGNAMVKASLCNDESRDDNERENKNTKAAPEHANGEHCRGFRL